MQKTTRIVVHVDPSMAKDLKDLSAATGSSIGEIVRRAIRLSAFADAQTKIETRRAAPVLLGSQR